MLRISRAVVAVAALALLLGGFAAGSVLTALRPTDLQPRSEAGAGGETDFALPVEDVNGNDLARLPRYPGSFRTEYSIRDGEVARRVSIEYLVSAPIGDVRVFYRTMFGEHDWTVADQSLDFGEWVYVLVDDVNEAIVEIESRGRVTEIDIDLTTPISSQPTSAPDDTDD